MEELDEFIRRKRENYNTYRELFKDCEYGHLMPFREGTESNKWFYSFVIDRTKIKATMREIITELEKRKVQTRAIWGLINDQKPYKDAYAYKIETSREYSNCVLNIPCSTNITKEEIVYTVEQVKEVLAKIK